MYIYCILCELSGVALLFSNSPADTGAVAVVLVSVCACGLTIYFNNSKAAAFFAVFNFACCFWNRAFLFFWQPALFFSARKKEFITPILCAVSLIADSGAQTSKPFNLLCVYALCWALGAAYEYGVQNYKKAVSVRDSQTQKNLRLSQKNKDLETSLAREAERASSKERERIAGEMHDNAGHMLARAILMTGALKASALDGGLADALNTLEDTLKDAMDSIRASVHKLKEDALDLERAAKSCAEGFPNFKCRINCSVGKDVPAEIKYVLVSALRECFSNSARHSDADEIDISIEEHPAFYKLVFKDNGGAKADFTLGMGLNGIAERAAAAGGRARFYVEDGFGTHIMLPKSRT